MHRRLRLTTAPLLLLLALLLSSQALAARPAPSHGSATEPVKLLVDNEDKQTLASLRRGQGRQLADYGSFSLWLAERAVSEPLLSRATVSSQGDFDTIYLRDGAVDRAPGAQSPPAELSSSREAGSQLWIVQFVGPIADGWLEDLAALGAAPVIYMPNNAYVIWAEGATIAAIEAQIATGASPLQWSGPYHPAYRLAPQLAGPARQSAGDAVDVTVQLYTTDGADATVARLLAISAAHLAGPERLLGFTTLRVRLPADQLAEVAGWADVFNVEPYVAPELNDEIQAQVMAGNLSGGGASAPGYLAWLQSKGVPTDPALYPIVAVVDDGVDNGTTAPNHADFYLNGNPASGSRLVANVNCTSVGTADGGGGHGSLNAGILGGYNNGSGAAYEDGAGYNYGLGISPWARMANTKVFRDNGDFDVGACGNTYAGIVAASYNSGAAFTTNSWGAPVGGAYNTDSQAFDSLTRDAMPGLPGLQPMLHIFSAGNSGSGAQTIGSPGTAKNVLTVGAGENPRANGFVDGCLQANADNYNDIPGFSSRGPTSDQRTKPDLVAPGNHVVGPASQIGSYNGSGVCDMYYPAGQTLYALSSGTSHSTPAVAGAASLLYVRYQQLFGVAPSPAMLKAFLLNSTRYLDGNASGGNLPSNSQGWGGMDLSAAFDGAARQALDQGSVLGATGDEEVFFFEVADSGRPTRITLAWSDAPGSTTGASYVNNLDMRVVSGGQLYLGNLFSGQFSATGGSADQRNNVEQVILPAGASGPIQVIVRGANIAGDGLPQNGDPSDQDFALYASNLVPGDAATLAGTVRRSNGDPVADATVRVGAVSTQTDAAGAYTIRALPGSYTATAEKTGFLSHSVAGVTLSLGATTALDFSLEGGSVSGVVRSAFSPPEPIAGVQITVGPFTTTSAADGSYSLELPTGSHTISASHPLYATVDDSITVTDLQNLVHDITMPGGGLAGTVVSEADGSPLAGVAVALSGPAPFSLTTGADGQYAQRLPTGSYTVTLSKAGYATATLSGVTVTSGITATADAILSPHIEMAPAALVQAVEMGQTATASLTVINNDAAGLSFNAAPRIGDSDSYLWEPIAYGWQDASDGTALTLSDDAEANITLPFTFPFYGEAVTALRIGNNGGILVGATSGDIAVSNRAMSDSGTPNWLIAPFWDDLDDNTGSVSWKVVGAAPSRRAIIQWTARPRYNNIGAATFQAQLGEDGSIVFQYSDVDFGNASYNAGASATVGVRGPGAAASAQHSFNAPAVAGLTALCFRPVGNPPCGDSLWLSLDPRSGTVAPDGGSQALSVGFDAGGFEQPGVYTGTVLLSHDAGFPTLRVPVTMNVTAPASYGRVSGGVGGNGSCGPPALPLAGAHISISGATSVALTSDGQGAFEYWLPAGSYTATITATGYLTRSLELTVTAGGELILDPALDLDAPCVAAGPDALLSSQPPDSVVTRTLTIANHGAADLTWTLGCMAGLPWAGANPVAGSVAAGASDSVTVSFDSAGLGLGLYSGELCVQSDDPSTPSLSVTLTLAVSSFGVELTPATDERTANVGAAALYTLSVTNTGSFTDTFDLTLAGNSWATTLTTDTLTLGPGQAADLEVAAEVPAGAASDDQDSATVTVTSQGSAAASASATLTTGVSPTDNTPPTATMKPFSPLAMGGGDSLTLPISFVDVGGVELASLNTGNIRVTGPDGLSQLATLVSVGEPAAGGERTAIYRIAAPGGRWDPADNGAYTVTLLAGQVRDTAGNVMAAAEIGGFAVNIRHLHFLPLLGSRR